MDDFEGHTPGPWLAGKPSSVVGWPVVAPSAHGRVICNVSFVANRAGAPAVPGDGAFNRESTANASLIAAAPDLLAERDRLLAEIERLREAAQEGRTDLLIAANNARDAAKTDTRWQGVAEKLMARVAMIDAALAQEPTP